MNLFCLPEYSILIGHYETTGLRSIFITLLSPMWTIHFTLVLIQFICVACLLVCKYTNQKRLIFVPIQIGHGVWYILAKILHSDWLIWCNLFSESVETLLHLSTDFWSNNFAFLTWKLDFDMLRILQWMLEFKFES